MSNKNNFILSLIKSADMFATDYSFLNNNKKNFNTFVGGIISIAFILITLLLILIREETPNMKNSYLVEDVSSFDLSNFPLLFEFHLKNTTSSDSGDITGLIDISSSVWKLKTSATNYYPGFQECDRSIFNLNSELNMDFLNKKKSYGAKLYCLSNSQSLYSINSVNLNDIEIPNVLINKCNNKTQICHNNNGTNSILENFVMKFYYPNSYLDPLNYTSPVKYFIDSKTLHMNIKEPRNIFIEFQKNTFTSESGWLFKSYFQIPYYSVLNYHFETLDFSDTQNLMTISFTSNLKNGIITRSYEKYQDRLSDLGGFLYLCTFIFRFFVEKYNSISYKLHVFNITNFDNNGQPIQKKVSLKISNSNNFNMNQNNLAARRSLEKEGSKVNEIIQDIYISNNANLSDAIIKNSYIQNSDNSNPIANRESENSQMINNILKTHNNHNKNNNLLEELNVLYKAKTFKENFDNKSNSIITIKQAQSQMSIPNNNPNNINNIIKTESLKSLYDIKKRESEEKEKCRKEEEEVFDEKEEKIMDANDEDDIKAKEYLQKLSLSRNDDNKQSMNNSKEFRKRNTLGCSKVNNNTVNSNNEIIKNNYINYNSINVSHKNINKELKLSPNPGDKRHSGIKFKENKSQKSNDKSSFKKMNKRPSLFNSKKKKRASMINFNINSDSVQNNNSNLADSRINRSSIKDLNKSQIKININNIQIHPQTRHELKEIPERSPSQEYQSSIQIRKLKEINKDSSDFNSDSVNYNKENSIQKERNSQKIAIHQDGIKETPNLDKSNVALVSLQNLEKFKAGLTDQISAETIKEFKNLSSLNYYLYDIFCCLEKNAQIKFYSYVFSFVEDKLSIIKYVNNASSFNYQHINQNQ